MMKIEKIIKPRLKLVRGTRFVSFLFIGCSILIAAGILWAANMYYNIDTGEVVTEQIQRVTGVLRATAGAIVGGTATQNPSTGYAFEVVGQTKLATTTVATGPLELTQADQLLKFTGGTSNYTGFKAITTLSTTTIYTWPGTYPAGTEYYLTVNPTTGQMSWGVPTGAGDITTVGDCASGDCFTSAAGNGNILYFDAGAGAGEISLTAADAGTNNYTITLPAQTGTVALGSGTANYVAYWTGTNTLAGEQYLATSRGGIGANSSAWNGMVRVVGGGWGAVTGTANYAAYWSDANTVAAEQYLALSRGGTGAGLTANAGGIVYSAASALAISAAGTANQILTSGGTAAPSWTNIADLINATNGLTESGTTALTLKLGGALTETTTIPQANFDMIFALTGTGDFRVTDGTNNIFQVTNDGKVLFGANNYPIAESGKQILRELIPILGFDLPVQTATTSYVQISRVLEDYPFSAASSGTTRVHKFIIRYADATTTTSTIWRVYNVTAATTTATFTVPPTDSTDLEMGEAYITGPVTIPTNTDDWRLDLSTPGTAIRVYQIFLAAYDQIQ